MCGIGLLIALLCLAVGATADGTVPPAVDSDQAGIRAALHDLLVSGDFSDLDTVSRQLGVKFYRTGSEQDRRHLLAISSVAPHFLFPGVRYDAFIRERGSGATTYIELRFWGRDCANLMRWAQDWGYKYQRPVMGTDGDSAPACVSTECR
jgi:hypothetical protein